MRHVCQLIRKLRHVTKTLSHVALANPLPVGEGKVDMRSSPCESTDLDALLRVLLDTKSWAKFNATPYIKLSNT